MFKNQNEVVTVQSVIGFLIRVLSACRLACDHEKKTKNPAHL